MHASSNRVGGKCKLITAAPTLKLKQLLVAQEVYNIGLDYARWKEKNISNRNHYFTTYSKLK